MGSVSSSHELRVGTAWDRRYKFRHCDPPLSSHYYKDFQPETVGLPSLKQEMVYQGPPSHLETVPLKRPTIYSMRLKKWRNVSSVDTVDYLSPKKAHSDPPTLRINNNNSPIDVTDTQGEEGVTWASTATAIVIETALPCDTSLLDETIDFNKHKINNSSTDPEVTPATLTLPMTPDEGVDSLDGSDIDIDELARAAITFIDDVLIEEAATDPMNDLRPEPPVIPVFRSEARLALTIATTTTTTPPWAGGESCVEMNASDSGVSSVSTPSDAAPRTPPTVNGTDRLSFKQKKQLFESLSPVDKQPQHRGQTVTPVTVAPLPPPPRLNTPVSTEGDHFIGEFIIKDAAMAYSPRSAVFQRPRKQIYLPPGTGTAEEAPASAADRFRFRRSSFEPQAPGPVPEEEVVRLTAAKNLESTPTKSWASVPDVSIEGAGAACDWSKKIEDASVRNMVAQFELAGPSAKFSSNQPPGLNNNNKTPSIFTDHLNDSSATLRNNDLRIANEVRSTKVKSLTVFPWQSSGYELRSSSSVGGFLY